MKGNKYTKEIEALKDELEISKRKSIGLFILGFIIGALAIPILLSLIFGGYP